MIHCEVGPREIAPRSGVSSVPKLRKRVGVTLTDVVLAFNVATAPYNVSINFMCGADRGLYATDERVEQYRTHADTR